MFNKNKILTLIILSIVITLCIWILSKAVYNDWFVNPYKYPAKIASLSATILFCWSMILSSRSRIIEKLSNGLDSVYKTHAWVGASGFIIVFLHPFFLALDKLPDIGRFASFFALKEWSNFYFIGTNMGIIALVSLVILIYLSSDMRIPYHVWKATHKLMTVFFGAVIAHVVLVDADIANYPVLAVWMYAWMSVAFVCGIYMLFGYRWIGHINTYEVESIEKFQGSQEIWLKPKHKSLVYKPSQFVFASFLQDNLSSEPHPFSIANAPSEDGRIKFGIKQLGDYTRSLRYLKEGSSVVLHGPYGTFSDKFLRGNKDCIFIGGGIGITPFLGMWDMALHTPDRGDDHIPSNVWKSPRVNLFYVVNNEEEATFDNDIKGVCLKSKYCGFGHHQTRGHHYELYIKNQNASYISAQYIKDQVGDVSNKYIFICGPEAMKTSLITQFKQLGVKNSSIITEDFTFRHNVFGAIMKSCTKMFSSVKRFSRVDSIS